jgi:hypothetical protein
MRERFLKNGGRYLPVVRRAAFAILATLLWGSCEKETVIVEPPSVTPLVGNWLLAGFTGDSGTVIPIDTVDSLTLVMNADGHFYGDNNCNYYGGWFHFLLDRSIHLDAYGYATPGCRSAMYWLTYVHGLARLREIWIEQDSLTIVCGDNRMVMKYKRL